MRSLPIIILAIMIFSVTLVYAAACGETKFNDDGSIIVCPDNPDLAADYKLNYAIVNTEADLAKSKILIYNYDIEYVKERIKGAQKLCIEVDGPHCDYVKDYQDALVKLANVQSQQTGNPPESTTSSPADGEKTKKGALDQLKKWLKDLKDMLAKLLTGWRP